MIIDINKYLNKPVDIECNDEHKCAFASKTLEQTSSNSIDSHQVSVDVQFEDASSSKIPDETYLNSSDNNKADKNSIIIVEKERSQGPRFHDAT